MRRLATTPVQRGIIWLLNFQGADGSLDSGPIMRVPEGNDKEPWNNKHWKLDSPNGVNILVRDQNRLFTTATVLAAFADFLRLAGDRYLMVNRAAQAKAFSSV